MMNGSVVQRTLSTEMPMGCFLHNGYTFFKVFSPEAETLDVVIYEDFDNRTGLVIPLEKAESGVWTGCSERDLTGKLYVLKVTLPESSGSERTDYLIADPWSRHVVTKNNYLQFPKTLILPPSQFDWSDDTYEPPSDPRDLIIYETHLRDLTAHWSAKTPVEGAYNDFRKAETGGVNHLKRMGVNAVEFLPLQKFAYFEPPFEQETETGIVNTWNPYAVNYWGYMTSFFLAPETMYASDGNYTPESIIGHRRTAELELKELIKALHREGIAVIMDVVYNHSSNYDLNPLKYLARNHYYSSDGQGNFTDRSRTGNDINTSAEFSRKLIIDSLTHWLKEYNVDGFRFDLAGIIDPETVNLITREVKRIKPNALLIAEPWGGEYKPAFFSGKGWASWNDRFRNGIKGRDPVTDKGFIFGSWHKGTSRFALENFIRGTLAGNDAGLFQTSAHSVNYLESHDGYTLGDFIRIGFEPELSHLPVPEERKHLLSARELAAAKLAALTLFVSQGITMIHAGQEWARSKIIEYHEKDERSGFLDYDSYNKDNETNWLNFTQTGANKPLFDYYLGLIRLRLNSPGLRKAAPEQINFKIYKDPLHITFSIFYDENDEPYEYFISLNGNAEQENVIVLPEGYWEVVADHEFASDKTKYSIKSQYTLQPLSGIIARKLRVLQS